MYIGIEEFEFMFLVIWEKWIYPVPTIHYTGINTHELFSALPI